jgi:tetratricopeptide (TPR) repeat protein
MGGASPAQARAVIDGFIDDSRVDMQVGESHEWSRAAKAFFFAGETEAASDYFKRAQQSNTGSESDLLARIRLQQIAGNIQGAREAAERALNRYENDYSRRNAAWLLFMTNSSDRAWATILPRLAVTDRFAVWMAALTGHRLNGTSLALIRDWIVSNKLQKANVNFRNAGQMILHLDAVMDRVPTDVDIRILRDAGAQGARQPDLLASSATLVRMALEGKSQPGEVERERGDIRQYYEGGNLFLLPLYTWVAWNANGGSDADIEQVRAATLSWDFDRILSKSLLLALEGKTPESRDYLRAARYLLSRIDSAQDYSSERMEERPIPAPYMVALAAYLMHRKTGDEGYRTDALEFVRSYQKVFPYWAWTYAMTALLEKDAPARRIAACRAKYLDRQSMFLQLSGENPDLGDATCRKALW